MKVKKCQVPARQDLQRLGDGAREAQRTVSPVDGSQNFGSTKSDTYTPSIGYASESSSHASQTSVGVELLPGLVQRRSG
jgi:hypothetical protein